MKENIASINCDVRACKHNVDGCGCRLDEIKISTDCTECTCCESFNAKQDQ